MSGGPAERVHLGVGADGVVGAAVAEVVLAVAAAPVAGERVRRAEEGVDRRGRGGEVLGQVVAQVDVEGVEDVRLLHVGQHQGERTVIVLRLVDRAVGPGDRVLAAPREGAVGRLEVVHGRGRSA